MPDGWTQENTDALGMCANVVLAANDDGRLEMYTYDRNLQLWHKWQLWDANHTTISGWSNWASFPRTEAAAFLNAINTGANDIFSGLTAVGDSCVQIVTQTSWGVQQETANGGWPNSFSSLDSRVPNPPWITGIGRDYNGALYIFGVEFETNALYYAVQTQAGAAWLWKTMDVPAFLQELGIRKFGSLVLQLDDWNFRSRLARTTSPNLASGCNADGRIEIFYPATDNVWHRWEVAPGSGIWSDWSALPSFDGYSSYTNIAVIQNGANATPGYGYRLELFALSHYETLGVPCTLYHCWQETANGVWGNWNPIAGLDITGPAGPWTKGPLRTARQQDGSLVIFALGRLTANSNESVCYIQQNGPSGEFKSDWVVLDSGTGIQGFDVGQNIDGTLFVVINSVGQIWHRQQLQVNSDEWST
jgi:hypothetical protein